jgi:hypothetical protein
VPGAGISSPVLIIDRPEVFDALLRGPKPILARREAGRVVVDVRAVAPSEDDLVSSALRAVWQ